MKTLDDFILRSKEEGYEWFNNEKAVAYLLRKGVLFVNNRPYIVNPWDSMEEQELSEKSTIIVLVLCNDIFMWGCADAEPITCDLNDKCDDSNELYHLLRLYLEDPKWGVVRWACLKRQEKPQAPIVGDMKKQGAWTEEMEALPPNEIDENRRKMAKENREKESEQG